MDLSPREKDKLLIFTAALLAEQRKARGIKLNYPETVAYISAAIMEGAREGKTVADLMHYGRTLLTGEDVMDGIVEMVPEIQIEATFPDGSKLVTIHDPIIPAAEVGDTVTPGEVIVNEGDIPINTDRETITVSVANTGDRPVQVGSHYHFYETNPALSFDREKTRGFRLNIAAGTAIRFEPGQSRDVELVSYSGARQVYGFNQAVMGKLEGNQ